MNIFTFPIRVYYEDTDASGVVYHANYLRYFERARSEWVRERGLDQERLRIEQGLAFTVASLSVEYLRPARLGDELTASVEVKQRKRASLIFQQRLHLSQNTQEILAIAEVRVACVSCLDFKPKPLPTTLFT